MRKLSLVLLALLIGCAAEPPAKEGGAPPREVKIAVIPQGATHEFWKSIHAGAIKAPQDLKAAGVDVTLFWKAPLREDDRDRGGESRASERV